MFHGFYDREKCSIMIFQVPISAVSTSSHSEQRSQARQSRWYCRNRWESRSVPFFIRSPFRKLEGLSVCIRLCRKDVPAHVSAYPLHHMDGRTTDIPARHCGIVHHLAKVLYRAHRSRWYCPPVGGWESRSVPFFIRSPFRKPEGLSVLHTVWIDSFQVLT
jgi:hypothetical protein